MSLQIDPDDVHQVLIGGEWLQIVPGSLAIDAYEFVDLNGVVLLGGGQCARVASTGFRARTHRGEWIAGPLTSLTAMLGIESRER